VRRIPLTLLLACSVLNFCLADEREDRQRLQQVQKGIAELQEKLANTSSARDHLLSELRAREMSLARLQSDISVLEKKLADQNDRLASLEQRGQELESHREQQSARIRAEITAAYRLGREEPVKLLLNQDDPEQLARQLRYYQYFLEARGKKLEQYRVTLAELVEIKAALSSQRQKVLDTRDQYDVQLTDLATEQEKRQQLLASMDRQLGTDKQRLAEFNAESKRLEDVIAALEKAIRDLNSAASEPFPKLKGKMVRPATGKVIKAFGSRRAANLKWLGWLIQTREGDPVVAIHHGRVVFSDYLRGQGLLMIIDHGGGYLSLYAHNQNLLKETGDWVQAGEAIARAGVSGGLDQSALYFEIRHNGKPLDPGPWLVRSRK